LRGIRARTEIVIEVAQRLMQAVADLNARNDLKRLLMEHGDVHR
jgi:hypothetical protein